MISYPRHLLGCIHFTEMDKQLQQLYGGLGKAIFHWEATWPTCLRRNIAVKLHETNLIPFERALLEGVQADSDPEACELSSSQSITPGCVGPPHGLMARGSRGLDQWLEREWTEEKQRRESTESRSL